MASRNIWVNRTSFASLPVDDRHEAWLSRSLPNFSPLFHTTPLVPFNATSEVAQLGPMILAYANITGQRWQRNRDRIRHSPSDALSVNISLNIKAEGSIGDRSFSQLPGVALITDLAQASIHESTSGQSIQLVIDRSMATAAGIDVAAMHGVILPAKSTAMLASHALQLRSLLPSLSEEQGPRVAQTLLDMLVLSIDSADVAGLSAIGAFASTAALRARDEIAQHLESPSLNIANLCRRLGLSRSSLHRLFEAEGGVQAYVRNARLDVAQRALLDATNGERIIDIAVRLGFSDAAHFSRCFRARFGESPSGYRARPPLA